MNENYKSGFVALVGQPNVGKSTLLNAILGKKISITSRKPQTTRHRIVGVKTTDDVQYVFVDTPGLHPAKKRAMNRYMNRAALSSLQDVDVVVLMLNGLHWDEQDQWILKQLKQQQSPVIIAINKVDLIRDKQALLPFMEQLSVDNTFYAIVPLSAKKDEQVDVLLQKVAECLPIGPPLYEQDQLTDRGAEFIVTERIREKLTRQLGDELPYAVTVTLDQYADETDIIRLAATIWVERKGQKAIVIGKHGETLKKIGSAARRELETYFAKKVYMQLWVKVKENWSDDERSLHQFGYFEE